MANMKKRALGEDILIEFPAAHGEKALRPGRNRLHFIQIFAQRAI